MSSDVADMDPGLRIKELEEEVLRLEAAKVDESKKASAAQRLKEASVKAVVAAESKIATLTCQVEAETKRVAAAENRILELEQKLEGNHSAETDDKTEICVLQSLEIQFDELQKKHSIEVERATAAEVRATELESKVAELNIELQRSSIDKKESSARETVEIGLVEGLQARIAALEDELRESKDFSNTARVKELNGQLEHLQEEICIMRQQHKDALAVADSCIAELTKAADEGMQYKEEVAIAQIRIDELAKELESLKLQEGGSKPDVNFRSIGAKYVENGSHSLPFCGSSLTVKGQLERTQSAPSSHVQTEKAADNVQDDSPPEASDTVGKNADADSGIKMRESAMPKQQSQNADVLDSRRTTWMLKFGIALQEAKLESQQEAAKKWCIERGISAVHDFKNEIDSFTQDMGLKPLQTKRLLRLLQSDAEINPASAQPDTGVTVQEAVPESRVKANVQRIDANKVMTRTTSANSKRSFAFLPPTAEEATVPRNVRMRVHKTAGAGLDGHATWYGIVLDDIEDVPGQPELNSGDCIIEIGGKSLQELDPPDCEAAFAAALRDGAKAVAETSCETCGELPPSTDIDCKDMWRDLEAFSIDYEVKFKILPGTRTLVMSGSRPAVASARNAATTLINKWI